MMGADSSRNRGPRDPILVAEWIADVATVEWCARLAGMRPEAVKLVLHPCITEGRVRGAEIDLRDTIGGSHGGFEHALLSVDPVSRTVALLHTSARAHDGTVGSPVAAPGAVYAVLDEALQRLDVKVAAIAAARARRAAP